ncbi:MAG: immunoglobulin domain-containing protein [Verrucomicrobiaceae bacterium]|nr:immunoglobulin domain-containing protein [Verrucomicrobiaceae bacterium]
MRRPLLIAALTTGALAQADFKHFEARQVHPIALTPDGSKLLAVNSPDAKLSVFDASAMTLSAEIPVGVEPVSVRARSNTEAWVVNEVSDSVTVVSLTTQSVVATLRVGDEPGDVVFAGGKAFVSCSRAGKIQVFDEITRADLGTIPLTGDYPRALCVSNDGSKVYAAFLYSGNHTTAMKRTLAPPQPAPTNSALPAPPSTALIVDVDDSRINYTVLDHDVAEIDVATQAVSQYLEGAGTCLFAIANRPGSTELWVANTEAHNLVASEPALNGVFSTNRLSRVTPGGSTSFIDLSNHAQPTAVVFSNDGATAWAAGFASDRVAKVDAATGNVAGTVDVRTGDPDSKNMRGARGLALNESLEKLFVLNKLANTISVVNTSTLAVITEVPVGTHDPVPLEIKQGSGYLFDARLSGASNVSCGICHPDADRDGLAWDLGNPGGTMTTTMGANEVIHDNRTRSRHSHPMKGPMVTQTLRDIGEGAPFHWRGDKPTIQSFNSTYENLMAGELQTSEDMDLLAAYIASLAAHPNPNRNLDRSLPSSFNGANPITGRDDFNQHVNHCSLCHTLPRGSNNVLDLPNEVGRNQPIKNPSLRLVYQKQLFNNTPGATSVSGFGMLMDGTGGLQQMPIVHPYVLDQLTTPADFANMTAFMLCFDSGVGRTVGYSVTVNASNATDSAVLADITLLEARAVAGDCDLVVRGILGGQERALLFDSPAYQMDEAADGTKTRIALLNLLTGADSVTFMGVLPGLGARLSIDHDEDGTLDGDEVSGAPIIQIHPKDAISSATGNITFSVVAKGTGLQYAWRRNGDSFGAANAASIVVSPPVAGTYDVLVSNGSGSAESHDATLTVRTPPTITTQPTSKLVTPGTVGTLSVTASGTGLSYQWFKNGDTLIGATSASIAFNNAQNPDTGVYTVRVSNGAGSVISNPATMDVPIPPVVTPLNLDDARVGENYSKQVTAANSPTRFNISGLPPGLTATQDGLISGFPTAEGSYTVTVVAVNAAGNSPPVSDQMQVLGLADGTVGKYTGTVDRQNELNANLGGSVFVETKSTGQFLGSFVLGTKKHSFSGILSPSGVTVDSTGTATITRPGAASLTVNFTVTPATKALNGTISDGTHSTTFTARQPGTITPGGRVVALLVKAPQRGDHSLPQGHCIGAYTINTKGIASGVITLADGTKVTFSAPVEEGGVVSLFKPLYSNTGSLLGTLGSTGATSWFKHPQPNKSTTRSYKSGFAVIDQQVIDAPVSPPTLTSAKMTFYGGDAPSPATRLDLNTITLGTGTGSVIAAITAPNPGIVTLTLAPTKATFTGSFMLLDPDTTKVPNRPVTRSVTISGVVINNIGYGFFQLPELPPSTRIMSGSATLEAN